MVGGVVVVVVVEVAVEVGVVGWEGGVWMLVGEGKVVEGGWMVLLLLVLGDGGGG